ncbi:hypothetical protein ACIPSA_04925 [Streptomyces sp. NPDC086549]|uniref:hypothetical protein n=1 Tax=Streptomyces sp. NPDC086549 TaxID=3365752 RepID=UPI0037F9ACEF
MAADNAASIPEGLIVSVLSAVVVSVLGVANLWFQECIRDAMRRPDAGDSSTKPGHISVF